MVPRHPDPQVRRAGRVLAMVGELHKRGHQKLRVMPFMSPSGAYWRCWIGPAILFYRNHGALLLKKAADADSEAQAGAIIARYSSGEDNHYFGWDDAVQAEARALADWFLERFRGLAQLGRGWDYAYADWYQRLLGVAEAGWFPFVLSDDTSVSFDHIPLSDMRPAGWRSEEMPVLPLPPPGESKTRYKG
jgi:hypothetical protein